MKARSHTPSIWLLFFAIGLFLGESSAQSNRINTENGQIPNSLLDRINEPFIGDLKEIRKRRILRVLVSYNRTNFFHTIKGNRGLEHDLMKAYEDYLNRGPRKERYQTHIVFLTRPFNTLLDDLTAGYGDIVASGLTVTPGRELLIDFTRPYIEEIQEILVSNKNAPKVTKFEELSGKQIVVVSNSSYVVHIEQINQAFGLLGLPGIEIVHADPLLESEDLLEMVNAGLFEYTVVDSHIAELYQQTFTNLIVQKDVVFHHGGEIAWAINKNQPDLKASLNRFISTYARPGKFLGNSIFHKYYKNTFWINKPLNLTALDQDPCLKQHFQQYAEFYDFDWMLIAAQAYQESRFQQDLVSHRNARGIMQIKRSTARSKIVNIPNIDSVENNIHAGVRYLAYLRDHYFDRPEYSKEDQLNFALASYNAGPSRVRKLQREAEARGLDPHKWFYNVEVIARKSIGHETVNYVTQIQKMMVGLKSSLQLSSSKKALKAVHLPDQSVEAPTENRISETEKATQKPPVNLMELPFPISETAPARSK